MLNRANPNAPAKLVFTKTELSILNQIYRNSKQAKVSTYLTYVARLGGYLARKNDPPPGNMVLWWGFSRLTDIHIGFELKDKFVDN